MFEKYKEKDDTGYVYEDGCYYDELWEIVQIGMLSFCGCGMPETNLEYVLNGIKWIEQKFNEGYIEHKIKGLELFGNENSMHFFLYWLDKEKYTEHGTTIYGSWLTDKGRELKAAIEEALAQVDRK